MKYVVSFIVAVLLFQCSTPVFKPLLNYVGDGNIFLVVPNIEYKADSNFINIAGTPFHFVQVEGGTFIMGSDSNSANESPAHRVTLSEYYISKTEVTQNLWDAIMFDKMPASSKNYPVSNVSWNDCQKFIKKLNKMTGYNFSLPTEAQWEFAARGGNLSQHYIYSGSDSLMKVAWCYGGYDSGKQDVGLKLPNELGIYDMSGNVEEWCQDFYGKYDASAQTNPTGPSNGEKRVARGGDYTSISNECRTSHRTSYTPTTSEKTIGLRLVLTR